MKNNSNINIIDKKDRLEKSIAYLKGMQKIKTQKDIAWHLETTPESITRALKGNEKYITDNFLKKIAEKFGFNEVWLLTGEGEMLKSTPNNSEQNVNCFSVNDRFLKVLEHYKYTAYKFSKETDISQSQLTHIKKHRNKVSDDVVNALLSVFPDVDRVWLLTGEGEMLNSSPKKKVRPNFGISEPKSPEEIKEELENLPSGGLRIKEYPTKLAVRVVTNKAQAGWSEGYYADEYLEDMPIVMIDADQEYKGKYLAFEVVGDSMEPDYLEGDIVICREVQRHLWSYKLHYNDWDFVIAHATQGIMLKEITAHNVEKGIITCHSINPAHKDFKVNLREVTYLYNVVEIRQKGSRKRWNRAKDFYTEENT